MRRTPNLRYTPTILCGIAYGQRGDRSTRVWFADWIHRRPTRSESACLSRAMSRLEACGLVRRLARRRVRLTRAGQAAVQPYLDQSWMFCELAPLYEVGAGDDTIEREVTQATPPLAT
jgi:hypothetical protein